MKNNVTTNVARSNVETILWLASLGFHLIPVHHLEVVGLCSCGAPSCKSPAKHPRTLHGAKDATNDPKLLIQLFSNYFPGANVGIATGANTGVVVLDVDPRHEGDRSLAHLEEAFGELPVTPTSITGGGGLHFYFLHPGGKVKNTASALGPGLDMRGENGFVIAPPSIHINGTQYRWMHGRGPDEVPLAEMPAWLITLVRRDSRRDGRHAARVAARRIAKNGVTEGARNDSVARLAGHLFRRRVDPLIVLDMLLAWNIARNAPPLPDGEVSAVVNSIAGAELRRREGNSNE